MKKMLFFLLGCVLSCLFFCSGISLAKFYKDKADAIEKDLSTVELQGYHWDYLANVESLVYYSMVKTLSPAIGREISADEQMLYNYYIERVKLEEKYTEPPLLGSEDYLNMLKFEEESAYLAVARILFEISDEGNDYQKICDQAITEVLKKHPIFYKQ